MKIFSQKTVFAVLVLLSLSTISACSKAPQVKETPAEGVETQSGLLASEAQGWWYLRYKIYWPGADELNDSENGNDTQDTQEQPSWYMGPLIADQIVAPVIKQLGQDLFLWRFHRRAADDSSGHQFSFIFYSTPEVADRVAEAIKANPLVDQLIEAGLLVEVKYPDTAIIDKPRISDTSDQDWPDEIQTSWPIFIMGASQMWLMMVETIADANPEAEKVRSVDELVTLYQAVEEKIDTLWRTESRHAYFHHLNALFGYEQLLVRF